MYPCPVLLQRLLDLVPGFFLFAFDHGLKDQLGQRFAAELPPDDIKDFVILKFASNTLQLVQEHLEHAAFARILGDHIQQ